MNLKKLRTMSFNEVSHRLKTAAARKLRSLAQGRYQDRMSPSQFLPNFTLRTDFDGPYREAIAQKQWSQAEEVFVQHMRARFTETNAPKFFIAPSQREGLHGMVTKLFANELGTTLAYAENVLARRFSYLGLEAQFDREINWHLDPLSQREWPKKFYTEIKFYGQLDGEHAFPGDVKNVWELNRHQHLAVLGKAYWYTGEERFAAELLAQCESWMIQNPFLWGVNWTSALEVAMRSLSWIWGYVFCLQSKAMSPALHARFLRMLNLHGQYVHRHLSFFTSPYNHLVGEATALFFLGTLFPEFKEAGAWRNKGWSILKEEVTKQFHRDGISVEQAVSYHHFTLGLYVQAMLLAERNGLPVPAYMRDRLEKALEFSMYSIQPDGRHPMIGDNDNALAFYSGEKTPWDFREYLALGAVMFERGDFKYVAEQYHEVCLWLLGPESFERFEALQAAPPQHISAMFAESGYAVLRDRWKNSEQYALFDCGPQSHGLFADENVSTAHGHADPLNLILCAHGQPFLIDTGMLTYNGDLNWQNYFRGGMAHNVVTVDEQSSCRVVGRLGYSHVPEVAPTFWTFQPDFAFAEAAFSGFDNGTRHRRGVFYRSDEYWLILDRLEGEGAPTLDRWFHFTPDCTAHKIEDAVVAALPHCGDLLVRELVASGIASEIFKGGAQPEQGWCAAKYGVKIPAPVLRMRVHAPLPQYFCTLLLPYHDKIPALQHEIHGEYGAERNDPFIVKLATAHGNDLVVFNLPGEMHTFGALTTDAKIAYLRRDHASGQTIVVMVAGTHLSFNSVEIFSSERRTDARTSGRELV